MSGKTNPGVRFQLADLSGGDLTISPACRGLMIGGAGVITGIASDMTTALATGELPVGFFPVEMTQINQTGTTATEITIIW